MICGEKELEEKGDCSQSFNNMESYQEQLLQQNPWSFPPVQSYYPVLSGPDPVHGHDPDPYLLPLYPPISSYDDSNLSFNRRTPPALQFACQDHGPSSSDPDQVAWRGSAPFQLQAELLDKMSSGHQAMVDAKALAASKSHSEAERRRRERINHHFARLRSLLPSTTKTDKASLLAEVIQHVKELKRQTSLIAETSPVPAEADEITVDTTDENGNFLIKASLCCEDRSDLLPDLIKTLKSLRLRTLRAELTTLGGRMRNVLFITSEEDSNRGDQFGDHQQQQYSLSSILEALKAVMGGRNGEEASSGSVKRQRTNVNMLEHRSP